MAMSERSAATNNAEDSVQVMPRSPDSADHACWACCGVWTAA